MAAQPNKLTDIDRIKLIDELDRRRADPPAVVPDCDTLCEQLTPIVFGDNGKRVTRSHIESWRKARDVGHGVVYVPGGGGPIKGHSQIWSEIQAIRTDVGALKRQVDKLDEIVTLWNNKIG